MNDLLSFFTHASAIMPTIALLLFVSMGLLVGIYLLSDHRKGHQQRMEGMALDDDEIPGERS